MIISLLRNMTVEQIRELRGLPLGVTYLQPIIISNEIYDVNIQVSCRMRAVASAISFAGDSDV